MATRSISSAGKLAAIALIFFGASFAAMALENETIASGLAKCNAWCNGNRTGNELQKCKDNCSAYWNCEGSDSTNKTCGAALGLITQGLPPPPPPKKPIAAETLRPAAPVVKQAQ